MNYLLLVDSGEEMVIDFCCVPDSELSSLDNFKPMVTKTALVKLSGPYNNNNKKDMNVENGLAGRKGDVSAGNEKREGRGESNNTFYTL